MVSKDKLIQQLNIEFNTDQAQLSLMLSHLEKCGDEIFCIDIKQVTKLMTSSTNANFDIFAILEIVSSLEGQTLNVRAFHNLIRTLLKLKIVDSLSTVNAIY